MDASGGSVEELDLFYELHTMLLFVEEFNIGMEVLMANDSRTITNLIKFYLKAKQDLERIRKEDAVMEMLHEHKIFGLQSLEMAKRIIKTCTEQNLPLVLEAQ